MRLPIDFSHCNFNSSTSFESVFGANFKWVQARQRKLLEMDKNADALRASKKQSQIRSFNRLLGVMNHQRILVMAIAVAQTVIYSSPSTPIIFSFFFFLSSFAGIVTFHSISGVFGSYTCQGDCRYIASGSAGAEGARRVLWNTKIPRCVYQRYSIHGSEPIEHIHIGHHVHGHSHCRHLCAVHIGPTNWYACFDSTFASIFPLFPFHYYISSA